MSDKRHDNPGRPPKYERQIELLVKDVSAVNKKLDKGLNKIADNMEDITQVAIDLALGVGDDMIQNANGQTVKVPRNPNVQMLKHLMNVGVAMIDKTGEGPDSPSQPILRNMRERISGSITYNTQVNIDNTGIENSVPTITPRVVDSNSR